MPPDDGFARLGQALDAAPTPAPEVGFDAKGNLVLPEPPAPTDIAAQCAWLTAVFALDPRHPITGGERQGLPGPDGHAELRRASVQSIRLEPIRVVNQPPRLIEALSGWGIPSDGAVPALRAPHCRQVAHVVRMLIGATATITTAQEAEAIVGTFLQSARPVEGFTTYGTSGQRYEAAEALRGDHGELHYLLDENTGELVLRVSDLGEAARRHVGASLPRGWLDARMAAIEWKRITLAGYGLTGRAGRQAGPHARCSIYRGMLAAEESEPEPASGEHVNTAKPTEYARVEKPFASHALDSDIRCSRVHGPDDGCPQCGGPLSAFGTAGQPPVCFGCIDEARRAA